MKPSKQTALFSVKESILLVLVGLFGVTLVVVALLVVLIKLGAIPVELTSDSFMTYCVLPAQAVSSLAIIVLVRRRLKSTGAAWSDVGFRRAPLKKSIGYFLAYYTGLIGFVILAAIVAVATGAMTSDASEPAAAAESVQKSALFITILTTVIIGPIIEEIIFRGILFPALLQKYSPVIGGLVTALIFAAVHIDPIRIVLLLPLAFYLSFMRHKLGSIYPGIALHMSWNALATVALLT